MSKGAVAPEGRVIFVLGAMAWGKGKTEGEALRNWRRNVHPYALHGDGAEVAVVDASDQSWVEDGDGAVMTPNGIERAKLIRHRTITKG